MRSGARIFLSLLLCLLFVPLAFGQGAKLSPDNPAENERDRPQERAQWFLRGRLVNGKPGAEQLHRAYNQKLNNRNLQSLSRIQASQSSGATGASPRPMFVLAPAGSAPWTLLGPAPTATAGVGVTSQDYGPAVGRVTAVVVDQTDPTGNTVLIGGASGGVWKTTNAVSAPRTCNSNGVCTANSGWTPLTDGQATLTVGSIALQPGNSNLILVGTGEANNSADSYYGLGILRSTDGGASWNLISSAACPASNPACAAPPTVLFHGLGFTRIAFSTDNIGPLTTSTVVATAAAASGGISVGAETGGSNARGLYFSTDAGLTWSRANVTDTAGVSPDPGSANSVLYNPQQKRFYANLRFHGIYSSADGANWTRLTNQPSATGLDLSLASCPSRTSSACSLYRAEMALVPGRDEMYVWIYDSNENDKGIFQTKDGGTTWTAISTTGIDNCGDGAKNGCGNDSSGQGTYNITLAAVPNGGTTDLYAGGVNQYKCSIKPTDPTCTSPGFLNLTHVYGCSPAGNIAHVHPDEHGIDFLGNDATGAFVAAHPGFDPPIFFGNDGGIYRVSRGSLLTSGTCPTGTPASPFDNLSSSANFSMIQFVGFSQAAADPGTLLGGTQDNGSPAVSNPSPSSVQWLSVNNGDGGFNAINPLNPNDWFSSNPAPLTSGGGIQRCQAGATCTNQTFLSVVTQDKIGGDFSAFYTFFMLDPQASTRMLVGSCRVWRGDSDGTQSNPLGGNWSVNSANGTPLSLNLDTQLDATCPDPTKNPGFMVNTMAAGGPCNGTCDPGITPASPTGGGSQVIWAGMEGIADTGNAAVQCPNGLPCGGQVWRTLAADSGTGSWSEVSGLNNGVTATCTSTPSACNINPKHYNISGIALDPNDTSGKTAYVTVMGFGVGHVFKTADAGATWAMLDGNPNGNGLPDAPADAVVTPPASAIATYPTLANVVYVGTDVGVFQSTGGGVWTEVGPSSGAGSLPNVAITQLKIYANGSDVRLRASTYGRGIWEVSIAPVPGFQVTVTPSIATAVIGQTATYNGSIIPFNGYNSSIGLTCQPVAGGAVPATCTVTPSTLAAGATSFTVTAGDPTAKTFNFKIVAVGADAKAITQQVPVTLNSVTPFTVGAAANASTPAGAPATTSFTVTASSAVSSPLVFAFTCSGLPAGAGPCNFSPAAPTVTAGVTANINVTIPTTLATVVGSYLVTITATASGFPLTTTFTLTVLVAPEFTMSALSPATLNLSPTDTATSSFTLKPNETLSGSVALVCIGLPTGAGPCDFTPTSPSLTAGQTTATPVNLKIPLSAVAPGTYTATVNATVVTPSGTVQHAQSLSLNVTSNSWGITSGALSPSTAKPGQPLAVTATITPSAYSGTVSLSCAVADTAGNSVPGTTCAMSVPSMTFTNTSAAQSSIANVTTTAATPAINQVVKVTAADATTNKSLSFNYSIIDYTVTAGTASPVLANASIASFPVTLTGVNGYTGTVQATCNVPSSTLTCTLTPPSPYLLNNATPVTATASIIAHAGTGGTYSANVSATDAAFNALTHSQTVSIVVQDFQIVASPSSETVKAGGTATAHTISLTPQGGFSGTVSFDPIQGSGVGCTGLPALTTCTFSALTVSPGGSVTLTIQTTAPSVSQSRPPAGRRTAPLYALWLTMPGMLGLFGVAAVPKLRRGRVLAWIALALTIILLMAMAACGGSGGGSTTTPPPVPKPGTPAGTYTINVAGVTGSGATTLTHNTTITLTVQ